MTPEERAAQTADLIMDTREMDIGAMGLRYIAAALRAAIAEEREACAEMVARRAVTGRLPLPHWVKKLLENLAAAIRARSEPAEGDET